MLFILSKVIQLIGLATVGFGLYMGLTSKDAMTQELRLLSAGILIFVAGWLMQRRTRG